MSKFPIKSKNTPKILDSIENLEMLSCLFLDRFIESTGGAPITASTTFQVVECPLDEYPQIVWDNLMARGFISSIEKEDGYLTITWNALKIKELSDRLQ